MRNFKKLIAIFAVVLIAVAATTLFADTISNWSGNADGSCTVNNQTIYPFAYWSWQWNETQETINGTWSDTTTGAYGSLSGTTTTGSSECPYIVSGTWSIDYPVDIDNAGSFSGCLAPDNDTCCGTWWATHQSLSNCNGNLWGNEN